MMSGADDDEHFGVAGEENEDDGAIVDEFDMGGENEDEGDEDGNKLFKIEKQSRKLDLKRAAIRLPSF